MELKESLIFKGYFPENLPPAFFAGDIGDFIAGNAGAEWWSKSKAPVRPASYNASKRGITRRVFSLVHPVTMRDLAKFVALRWDAISAFFSQIDSSLSVPQVVADGDRAIEISTHATVEATKIDRLSRHRFIAKTDISRFYHSIYTHSLPWAFHGKLAAKADRDFGAAGIYFNRADHILRCGQDGQTVGIPVGPDTSRVIAEVVATAIDVEFKKRCDVGDVTIIRHVDDVWLGAHSHADAERALWRYREAIREFELDINESKTRIYSADFRFADAWPTDLSVALETALASTANHRPERLRAALERAFAMAVADNDDGILKYVIKYLDRHSSGWSDWTISEPFLKRSVVHFGHTADYVARVIVWRHLAKRDLDVGTWSKILAAVIDTHGRVGNDSEVCWATYACARLGTSIELDAAQNIVRNCGALAVVSVLNCADKGLVDRSIFDEAYARMRLETATGPFWPVLMEWKSRKWPKHDKLKLNNDVIGSLAKEEAHIFDLDRLPLVFSEIEAASFDEVERAIEARPSMYDDDSDVRGSENDDRDDDDDLGVDDDDEEDIAF
jgi:hypothetical protein